MMMNVMIIAMMMMMMMHGDDDAVDDDLVDDVADDVVSDDNDGGDDDVDDLKYGNIVFKLSIHRSLEQMKSCPVQYRLKMSKGKGLTGESYRTLASKDATTISPQEAAKRVVTLFTELKKFPRLRKVA